MYLGTYLINKEGKQTENTIYTMGENICKPCTWWFNLVLKPFYKKINIFTENCTALPYIVWEILTKSKHLCNYHFI